MINLLIVDFCRTPRLATFKTMNEMLPNFDLRAFFDTLFDGASNTSKLFEEAKIVSYKQGDINALQHFISLFNTRKHRRALKLIIHGNIYRQFLYLEEANADDEASGRLLNRNPTGFCSRWQETAPIKLTALFSLSGVCMQKSCRATIERGST